MSERGLASEAEPAEPVSVVSSPKVDADKSERYTELSAEERKGKLKEVRKEGREMAITLDGVSQMGGLSFFCESVEKPCGDIQLLLESVNAMNAKKSKKTRAHQEAL